jgi:hypothetical protein
MKNVGGIDRILRIVIGLAILGWGAYGWSATGTFNLWALIGLVPLFTGVIGWCPPYSIFGISTCSTKKKS